MLFSDNNFVNKLTDHLKKNNQLEKIIALFVQEYSFIPCIGVEIEFYLSKNIDVTEFQLLLGYQVKQEKGDYQFEIDLPPTTEIIEYINTISWLKSKIESVAQKLGGSSDFSAKPFVNDYGNSMHFHVSFIKSSFRGSEKQRKMSFPRMRESSITHNPSDVFFLDTCLRGDDNIRTICTMLRNDVGSNTNDFLTHAAQSVCHYMLDTFLVFMPAPRDYLRFDKNFMAPTHVSFGGNNRTVAVRIPDSLPKRLEHRLATPMTDPYIAIFTILKSILLGLQFPDRINKLPKIYGNAFDEQYHLLPLPKSREESEKLFRKEFFEWGEELHVIARSIS